MPYLVGMIQFSISRLLFACLATLLLSTHVATADLAERDRIRAFLEVTGFDVALDSIRFSASAAPEMLGIAPSAFGADWERLSGEVFDVVQMRSMALDILEQTLDSADLDHAVEFYASDLGRRIVTVENAAHESPDDDIERRAGRALIAEMQGRNDPRLALLRRMMQAINVGDTSLRAVQEIQFRFLIAASAAGVIDLKIDTEQLRGALRESADETRKALEESSMASAAFTYRDISDPDLEAYADALEHPRMQRVYALLNPVQFEIMANRFEALALRMAELHPGQDI